jgi:hypothetical protein
VSDELRHWQEKRIDLLCDRGVAKSHLYNLPPDAGMWDRQAAMTAVARCEAALREHEATRP